MAEKKAESKQGVARKFWLFTLNNPDEHEAPLKEFRALLQALLDEGTLKYAVFQLEKGEQGTPHYQGYIQLAQRKRLTWLKDKINNSAWWKACDGNGEQNEAYCTKEETRIQGPWRFGDPYTVGKGRRTDYEAAYKAIKAAARWNDALVKNLTDIAPNLVFNNYGNLNKIFRDAHPAKERGAVEVIVIIGQTGQGKSRLVRDVTTNDDGTSTAYKPMIQYHTGGSTIWWDGYNGQQDIWFDDVRRDLFSTQDFLLWFDPAGPALSLPVKHGSVNAEFTRIFVTSNELPNTWFAQRRAEEPATWAAICRRLGCDKECKGIIPSFINYGEEGTREDLERLWTDYIAFSQLPVAKVFSLIFVHI